MDSELTPTERASRDPIEVYLQDVQRTCRVNLPKSEQLALGARIQEVLPRIESLKAETGELETAIGALQERRAEAAAHGYRHVERFLSLSAEAAAERRTAALAEHGLLEERVAEAAGALVESVLPWVIKVGYRYGHFQHAKKLGVPAEELIQEGNAGALTAAYRYDPARGYKFATYATWWIRQRMTRYLQNNGRVVRVTINEQETHRKRLKRLERLEAAAREDPAQEEALAKERQRLYTPRKGRTEADIIVNQPRSEPLTYVRDGVESVKPIRAPDTIEEEVQRLQLQEVVQALLEDKRVKWDGREAEVLKKRFGIGTDDERTLEDIGREYGVSRERIRQIEKDAYRRIRRFFLDNPDEVRQLFGESLQNEYLRKLAQAL